jgi:hypothetical protein
MDPWISASERGFLQLEKIKSSEIGKMKIQFLHI